MNSDYIGGTIAIPMVRVCYPYGHLGLKELYVLAAVKAASDSRRIKFYVPYGHLSVISRLSCVNPVLILC